MTLFVDSGATIQAVADQTAFPLIPALPSYPVQPSDNSNPRYQAFLFANGVSNLRITGTGTVDGAGKYSTLTHMRFNFPPPPQHINLPVGSYWWNLWHEHKLVSSRPHLVEIMNSKDIEISHLHFQYSPMYNIHPYNCKGVTVQNVNIFNPVWASNTDGIDPDSCTDVRILNNTIYTMDDNISLKSGQFAQGTQFNTPTQVGYLLFFIPRLYSRLGANLQECCYFWKYFWIRRRYRDWQ